METPLTIFYTYRLKGKLALLPRLYTFLRRLRGQYAADGRALLLDLGESCADDVFPCALTGGRSTLIALDAMGYDAANVSGQLTDDARLQLQALHFQMVPVETGRLYQKDGICAAVDASGCVPACQLCIDMKPASETRLDGHVLQLAGIAQGQVGMVTLDMSGHDARLTAVRALDVPDDVPHDPTIAGTVEFILSEARYLQRKQNADAN